MEVTRYAPSAYSSNVYGFADSLVDVGDSVEALPERGHVLLTHSHVDHVACLKEYVESTDASVYVHREEWRYVEGRESELRRSADALDLPEDFLDVDVEHVEDGDVVDVGVEVEVLHTPGHTPGSVSYYVPESGWLFTGDTLFGNGAPGDAVDEEALEESIHRLSELDVSAIYPGHMEPAVDDIERRFQLALAMV